MAIIEFNVAGGGLERPYFILSERDLRHENLFMAESPYVIERALDAGIRPVSFLAERRNMDWISEHVLPHYPEVPVVAGNKEELSSITGYSLTRGLLCVMERPKPSSFSEVAKGARRLCVLYDVCDATNVGAIFRSAAALGFDAVVLSRSACDPLSRRAIRTSMGTVFQLPWCKCDDVLADLKNVGFSSVCTALNHKSISLEDFPITRDGRYGVIFGEEGYGLPEKVISQSDFTVSIPMRPGVDSLNVGAAAAIILWHFRPLSPNIGLQRP